MGALQQVLLVGETAPLLAQSWNPADAHADIVLSGGNLIATRDVAAANYRAVRARYPLGIFKRYWEVAITADGGDSPAYGMLGIVEATASLATFVGDSPDGFGYASREGCRYYNGSNSSPYPPGSWATADAGDVLMFAADPLSNQLWFGINGTWLNAGDPFAGTGDIGGSQPTSYPATSLYRPGAQHTANFVGPFVYTPPTTFAGF